MRREAFYEFFKGKKHRKLFLTNSFYTFSIIIIGFEIVCSLLIYYFLSHSHLSRLKAQLVTENRRIENTLKDIFSETHQVMVYVGKQISLHSSKNPHFIEKVLINSSEIPAKTKTIYSWSLFDWVDLNHHVVVNSQIGIVRNSPEKVHDSYIWKCPKSPWTLQLSHPTIGNTSGMWAIPAGVGITNSNNVYLGTLNVGFNIAELNNKIQQALASKESSFVILDDDLRIVLQSADNSIDPKSSYYRDMLVSKKYFKEDNGYLENPIFYKDIEYFYYKKMEDYPYTILTGFDKPLVQRMFWTLILPRLLELYGVGCFCLGLLYLLRRKMFNLAKLSGNAKETFLQHLNMEMRESISSILTYSKVLLKFLMGETKVIVTKERQAEFMEKIYKEALNLYTVTSNNLNMNYIDIPNLIENSVNVQIGKALTKDINIKTYLAPALLPFYGDEFRLKQIITSLMSLAMEYSPKGSTLKISATNEVGNDQQVFLVIKMEDNGFSLSAEDIMRISEKFANDEEEETFMVSQLEFSSIEKLIKLHNGTCYICNKGQKGKIIKVTLPYSTDNELERINPMTNDRDNIYVFPDSSKSHT